MALVSISERPCAGASKISRMIEESEIAETLRAITQPPKGMMVLHDAPSTGEVCHHEVKSSFSLEVNECLRSCVNRPRVNREVISRLPANGTLFNGSGIGAVWSRTERSGGQRTGVAAEAAAKYPELSLKVLDEPDQRPQEFDQSPTQEAEPCTHCGHDQYGNKRNRQPASCVNERVAHLRLLAWLCLLMTVHWLTWSISYD